MKIVLVLFLLFVSFLSAKNDTPSLSMHTYKKLTAVDDLIKNKQMFKAEEMLHVLLNNLPDNKTDRAYIFNSAGMYYLQLDDYKKARKFLLEAYNENALSDEYMLQLTELIANLYMHSEEFKKAVEFYERYIKIKPLAEKRIIYGCSVGYYNLEKFEMLTSLISKHLKRFKPDESLYRLLFASYYERKQTKKAIKTVNEMIQHWDRKREYWMQLSGLYYEDGNIDKALDSIELAYNYGLLEKESDYMQYIYTLLDKEIPYKAAELLEKFIKEKRVANNERNQELLKQCWRYSREQVK